MIRAAGMMGWSEEQFWFSTPSYFLAAAAAFAEQEQTKYRTGWEQARMIAYTTMVSAGHKIEPEKIIKLPWIDKPKILEWTISKEEIEEFNKKADAFIEKLRQAG